MPLCTTAAVALHAPLVYSCLKYYFCLSLALHFFNLIGCCIGNGLEPDSNAGQAADKHCMSKHDVSLKYSYHKVIKVGLGRLVFLHQFIPIGVTSDSIRVKMRVRG